MDRTLALCDNSLRMLLRFPLVLLDDSHSLDEDLFFPREYSKNFSFSTAMIAANHFNMIAPFYMELRSIHQSTSGASDTIFMKFFSRNSRATGPKMRVPRGFKSLSIITIALLSNLGNCRRRDGWVGAFEQQPHEQLPPS